MITFNEGQSKITLGKHKIQPSNYPPGAIDLHVVYPEDKSSGYEGKFVRVITFENKYSVDTFKNITPTNHEEDIIPDVMYWENGGYLYNKKTF